MRKFEPLCASFCADFFCARACMTTSRMNFARAFLILCWCHERKMLFYDNCRKLWKFIIEEKTQHWSSQHGEEMKKRHQTERSTVQYFCCFRFGKQTFSRATTAKEQDWLTFGKVWQALKSRECCDNGARELSRLRKSNHNHKNDKTGSKPH